MRGGYQWKMRLDAVLVLLLLVAVAGSHFEVLTPYEGEIFDASDVYFEFRLHGGLLDYPGHEILVGINGNEAMRTKEAYTHVKAPGLPAGLHYLILQVLDAEGKPGKLDLTIAFEVTTHPAPELIAPFPEGTVGIRSDELPLAEELDPQPYSGRLQQMFYDHQHPNVAKCKTEPYLIWEPWGIVGFGAQILGLRVAMSLGLQYGRVVVGNPEWENNLVNSELKWRFNLTESDQGSPWGDRGSLQQLSWCAGHQNIAESVRALPGVDMNDRQIRDVRVAGDLCDCLFESTSYVCTLIGTHTCTTGRSAASASPATCAPTASQRARPLYAPTYPDMH
jgi:hypothetical protein